MEEVTTSNIVYALTLEDLVALNKFHARQSPGVRRELRQALIGRPLGVIVGAGGLALLMGLSLWPALGVAVACGGISAVSMHDYQRRGYFALLESRVRQMCLENAYPGLLGEHTLEVDKDGITHLSACSNTRFTWQALDRIESEPGYTYLYLGAQVFTVRHDAIIHGDFKALLEGIGRYHQPDTTIAG